MNAETSFKKWAGWSFLSKKGRHGGINVKNGLERYISDSPIVDPFRRTTVPKGFSNSLSFTLCFFCK